MPALAATVGRYALELAPAGASPLGCLDMCGNVWEMTDQYDDGHYTYVILKGGSFYRVDERSPGADGPGVDVPVAVEARHRPRPRRHCYRQGGPQPVTHHLRYLQMGAALDRSKTIGFRCARDG